MLPLTRRAPYCPQKGILVARSPLAKYTNTATAPSGYKAFSVANPHPYCQLSISSRQFQLSKYVFLIDPGSSSLCTGTVELVRHVLDCQYRSLLIRH
jgi:hypothetical protein